MKKDIKPKKTITLIGFKYLRDNEDPNHVLDEDLDRYYFYEHTAPFKDLSKESIEEMLKGTFANFKTHSKIEVFEVTDRYILYSANISGDTDIIYEEYEIR